MRGLSLLDCLTVENTVLHSKWIEKIHQKGGMEIEPCHLFWCQGVQRTGCPLMGLRGEAPYQVKGGSLAQLIVVSTISTGYYLSMNLKRLGFAMEIS